MNNLVSSTRKIDHLTVTEFTREKFYTDYGILGKPFVINDFIESSVDWNLDFLCDTLGTQEFAVRDYGEGHFDTPRSEWTKYCDHIKMNIKDFTEYLRTDIAKKRCLYLAQNPIGDSDAAKSIANEMQLLTDTLGFEPAIAEASLNLWLGASGHTEPLHFDPSDGTMIMLHGKKRVILFPPKQTSNLYPFGFYDDLPFWISQVDPENPDLKMHPEFIKTNNDRYEVVLSPGQLLFIPTQWWHEVIAEGQGYVCSCNFFWKVKPFRRSFQTLGATVLYFMNLLPWNWVLRFNRFIHQFKKK